MFLAKDIINQIFIIRVLNTSKRTGGASKRAFCVNETLFCCKNIYELWLVAYKTFLPEHNMLENLSLDDIETDDSIINYIRKTLNQLGFIELRYVRMSF